MDLGLHDKIAVVTGASRGIGLAITEALIAEGAYVVARARGSSDELDALVHGGAIEVATVDLATPTGPADLVAAALNHGRVDIVINYVGAATPRLTSSVNSFLPDPVVIDYSASKAALDNFSKSLSKEVGPRGTASIPSARVPFPPRCGSVITE